MRSDLIIPILLPILDHNFTSLCMQLKYNQGLEAATFETLDKDLVVGLGNYLLTITSTNQCIFLDKVRISF